MKHNLKIIIEKKKVKTFESFQFFFFFSKENQYTNNDDLI